MWLIDTYESTIFSMEKKSIWNEENPQYPKGDQIYNQRVQGKKKVVMILNQHRTIWIFKHWFVEYVRWQLYNCCILIEEKEKLGVSNKLRV